MNVLHDAETTQALVTFADTALCAAKRAGRNQIPMAGRRSLEHNEKDAQAALETLEYQP